MKIPVSWLKEYVEFEDRVPRTLEPYRGAFSA